MRKIRSACSAVSTGRSVSSHHGSPATFARRTSTSQQARTRSPPSAAVRSPGRQRTSGGVLATVAATGCSLGRACPALRTTISASTWARGRSVGARDWRRQGVPSRAWTQRPRWKRRQTRRQTRRQSCPQTAARTATPSNPESRTAVTSAPASCSGASAAPTERIAARVSAGSPTKPGAALLNRWW
jgi:hypothetical protein